MPNYIHYLPKLREANHVPGITSAGTWEDKQNQVLANVGSGIEFSQGTIEKGVSSIPDVWARALLFQMALYEGKENPMHETILGEWRGLLSLIILKDYFPGTEISIKEVKIKADNPFGNALIKLQPEELNIGSGKAYSFLEYNATQREPYHYMYIVKAKDKVIGATSPATVFFTAADYKDLIPMLKSCGVNVDTEKGILKQPDKPEHLAKIKLWLKFFVSPPDDDSLARLQDILNTRSRDAKSKADSNRILNLFSNWYDELDARQDITNILKKPLDVEPDVDNPLIMNMDLPLYKSLSTPLKSTNETFESELLMNSVGQSRYIILHPNAFRIATDPKVVNSLTASSIGDYDQWEESYGTKLISVQLPKNTFWIKPEEYFLSDTLIIQANKEAILNDNGFNRAPHYIIPLKKEFWECFSTNDDILSLDPTFKEDKGQVVFSINIPILSRGNVHKITISKVYLENTGNDHKTGKLEYIDFNPLIELWPDFYSDKWKRYFLFNDMVKKYDFSPISRSSLKVQHKSIVNDEVSFQEFDAYPDGIQCKVKRDGGALKDAGIIFLKRKTAETGGGPWKAAVDFGTSNTNIYIRKSDGIKQFSVSVLPLQITVASKDSLYTGENFFLPNAQPKIPFISVMKVFAGEQDLHHLMSEYSIHFISAPPSDSKRLKTDIKWSGSTNYLNAFLEHLSLLIAAEAMKDGASELDFYVSYPLAFKPGLRQNYLQRWSQALEKLKCFPNTKVNNMKDKTAATESVAVGLYFNKRLDATIESPGAICIDIGGGTSDVCVWSEKNIKFQTSVLLAGETVSNCFRKSKGLVRAVFSGLDETCTGDNYEKYVNELLSKISTDDLNTRDTFFASVLNFYLKNYSHNIVRRLTSLIEDKYFLALQDILMVEFGAVAYYAGMTVQKMRQTGTISNSENPLNLYWGGGASAFVSWLDFGDTVSPIIGPALFNKIMAHFNIVSEGSVLTKDPKSEAAYGLLCLDSFDGTVAMGGNIIGENFLTEDGTYVDYLQIDEEGDIFKYYARFARSVSGPAHEADKKSPDFIKEVVEGEPAVVTQTLFKTKNNVGQKLIDFIDILNDIRRKQMGIPTLKLESYTELAGQIENNLKQVCRTLKNPPKDEVVTTVEPVFIIEVKELIKAMIKRIA